MGYFFYIIVRQLLKLGRTDGTRYLATWSVVGVYMYSKIVITPNNPWSVFGTCYMQQ